MAFVVAGRSSRWARALDCADGTSGIKVDAYDIEPPDQAENISFPQVAGQATTWHPVGRFGEFEMGADPSDQVLFLCWSPGWGDTAASETLARFEEAGGRCLIFVGQARGRMTDDDAFFDALADQWEMVDEDSDHVAWWNLADVAQGWARRLA